MVEDPIGWLHLLSAWAALVVGGAVALAQKGTPRHRFLGRAYLGSMLVLNLTALLIYDLTGRANLFHFAALVSLVTLGFGVVAVRRRAQHWRPAHATWMLWSYVGLCCAAASEAIVRVPGLIHGWTSFGVAVGAASGVTATVGAILIHRTVARIR